MGSGEGVGGWSLVQLGDVYPVALAAVVESRQPSPAGESGIFFSCLFACMISNGTIADMIPLMARCMHAPSDSKSVR